MDPDTRGIIIVAVLVGPMFRAGLIIHYGPRDVAHSQTRK